ncbi:Sec-independent protein translocase protein TatB [Kordiimonas aestuarii]|uniref:Sec-independent protein translocase protein TatB n=1 Tax=Kordiimonas aestuarii TaxID=1005925 RepID=UPI0021D0E75C|nr:Sec-independent protein translocase protein TatB [Kordiimonas aestuarii]
MFDIGAMELFVVAVLALVVVGPKELPRLLKTAGGLMRRVRELSAEFRQGVEQLAAEAERETDPFRDLKKKEGLRPGMSPEEVTDHIMKNREAEEAAAMAKEPIKRKSDGTTKAEPKAKPNKAEDEQAEGDSKP